MSVTSSTGTRSRNSGATKQPQFKIEDIPENPLTDAPQRTKRAKEYEARVTGLLQMGMAACVENPSTVADAAAIIEHGPVIASKMGDLADHDERVRKAVDFITSGTENPYLSVAIATLPLVAQILRNHESDVTKNVEFKIPFTKKTVRMPFKIKLKNPFLRGITKEPEVLSQKVYGQPELMAALRSQGLNVAWNGMATGKK